MILLSELIIFTTNLLKITNATVLKTRHFKSRCPYVFNAFLSYAITFGNNNVGIRTKNNRDNLQSSEMGDIFDFGRLNRICPSSVYVRARARTNVRVCTCRCGWVYIRACVRCYIGNCQRL